MENLSSIDVVTTATLRPELLELTLKSFVSKFLSQFSHRRLIINIDALGNGVSSVDDMLDVCYKYFDDVIYRAPDSPSFPSAVKWGWEQVRTPVFLHLEDDWLLRKEIDAKQAIAYFNAEDNLASVSFNVSLNQNSLECDYLPLRPTLIRKKFVDQALPLFNLNEDPEKQWRQHVGENNPLNSWKYRLYGELQQGRYILEMGAAWRKIYHFEKWKSGQTSWQLTNNRSGGLKLTICKFKYHIKHVLWSAFAKASF